MEAHEYLVTHSHELSDEYPGKYIAIVGEDLVAVSSSGHEAFEKAILNISLSLNTQYIYYESDPRFLHIDLSHKDRIIRYIAEDI